MKKSPFIVLALAFILFTACTTGQNSENNLSADKFNAEIKSHPAAPVVDVRTSDEYSKGHLANSLNIDWNGTNFDAEIAKIDKAKPVYVYCLSGGRSGQAAAKMRADGFKEVYELKGGILKWRGTNLPETTSVNSTSIGMTKTDYDALVISDKIVLIDFYADWCGPCKKMKPYLQEISKTMDATVRVIRINADDNKLLMKALAIDELPTLLTYKKGEMTWRHSGFIGKEDVLTQLK